MKLTYCHDSNGNITLLDAEDGRSLSFGLFGGGPSRGWAICEQVLSGGHALPRGRHDNGSRHGIPVPHYEPLMFSGSFDCTAEQWRLLEAATRYAAGETVDDADRAVIEAALCADRYHAIDHGTAVWRWYCCGLAEAAPYIEGGRHAWPALACPANTNPEERRSRGGWQYTCPRCRATFS